MKISSIDHAFEKLEEADFFLDLLEIVTTANEPLPTQTLILALTTDEIRKTKEIKDRFSVELQVSYLLSAFANACYSAVEFVRRDKVLVESAKRFCTEHPLFYASGPDGGIRTINTHFRVVKASERIVVPPKSPCPFDDEEFDDLILECATPAPNVAIPASSWRTNYYLSDASPQDPISLICSAHHMDLTRFLNECLKMKSDF